MNKLLVVLVAVVAVVAIVAIIVLSASPFERSFSDHLVTVIHHGERYHVIPENMLDDVLIIVDRKGKRHYVLSEEKIRLLGPKLLTSGGK